MPKRKQSTSSQQRKSKTSPPSTETRDHSPLEPGLLKRLYAEMLRSRLTQQELRRSQSNSKVPRGREAIEVGCAVDLQPEDVILCPSNSVTAPLVAGVAPADIISGAHGVQNNTSASGNTHALFLSPAADSLAIAAGLAYAFQFQKRASVVFALDAGTTPARGVETLALIARDRLPVIAVIENHGGHPERLLGSARQHELPVISVDANDVVAVYRVAREAIFRARTHRGGTIIDCYPLPLPGGRSTDPLTAMEQYMARFGLWTADLRRELESSVS